MYACHLPTYGAIKPVSKGPGLRATLNLVGIHTGGEGEGGPPPLSTPLLNQHKYFLSMNSNKVTTKGYICLEIFPKVLSICQVLGTVS